MNPFVVEVRTYHVGVNDTDKRPRLGPGYQNVSISLMSALHEDARRRYLKRAGVVMTRKALSPPKRRVYWQRRRRM